MIWYLLIILLNLPNATEHRLLLSEVNHVRSVGCDCGTSYYGPVAPLKWNKDLADLAYTHAFDMQNGKYFSHYNNEGKDVGDRAEAIYFQWNKIGENIAVAYKSELSVMHAWLASEEHCKMIMEPSVKEMGAARVGNYWVQNFSATDPKELVTGLKRLKTYTDH